MLILLVDNTKGDSSEIQIEDPIMIPVIIIYSKNTHTTTVVQ